jgi:hypothetical protein
MIGKGLLERERSNVDARANAVRLTDAGREVLTDARPKMAQADARLLKLISGHGRRTTFVSLLRDLAKAEAGDGAAKVARAKTEKPRAAKPKPVKVKAAKAEKPRKGGKKAKKKTA